MKLSLKESKALIGILVVVLIFVLMNTFRAEVKGFFYSFSAPIQKTRRRQDNGVRHSPHDNVYRQRQVYDSFVSLQPHTQIDACRTIVTIG